MQKTKHNNGFGQSLILFIALCFSSVLHAEKVIVDGMPFDSLKSAVAAIQDGSTVYLEKGVYKDGVYITKNDISILGEPGVVFDGASADGKAALVLTGKNVVVESIECKNIAVPDGNGACIRFEGENITIRDLYVHDSQSGVKTSRVKGFVHIEFSKFERIGNRNGYSHGMYIIADELKVRYSQILSTKSEGSGIKSRSKRVIVENSLLASLDGVDSRLIDMAEYGELIVRDSILQQGDNSSNSQLIAYGLEKKARQFAVNRIELRNNLIFFDRTRPNVLISKQLDDEFINRGNMFIGDLNHVPQMVPGNEWYMSREDAKLEAYPFLPSISEREKIMDFVRIAGTPKNI
ncbi:right-handed parallel beta-helix repeat-containing protein [Psychrosphaera aestuarii]|uniref:hypothetical protein n=1 Tax=Psychrosphaera aestuarii TaxID=1266052 RepID=UPI001B319954|nr:hypothetical protein [Psychrosphaera aestuarii]